MQSFINFLANNYLWFLILTIILAFAVVGYFVDAKEKKRLLEHPEEAKKKEKKQKSKEIEVIPEVLNMENTPINTLVNKSKIKPEELEEVNLEYDAPLISEDEPTSTTFEIEKNENHDEK